MKKLKILFCLLCVGLFFGACEKSIQEAQKDTPKQEYLEDLEIIANNGDKIAINQKIPQSYKNNFKNIEPTQKNTLKDLLITSNKENIKVLFFFTTWCEPCVGILPHLENLQKQFGDKITIFGIGIDDLVGEVEDFNQTMQVFIEENKITFPVAFKENRAEFFKALEGLEGIPLIVLYDEKGDYIIHYLGAIPEEMIEFDLSQNLAKMRAK
ncbi:TlpA family protein disulfide reductase [Helicobacter pullorum]|uniref:TlpA family protein disulfide reductase n=1 Tax=Helicobacter pullorum TaxID=35818 RepID=UPI00241DB85D|nr:TlpA disulfide reductase family protein [Helicobacter pullorum]